MKDLRIYCSDEYKKKVKTISAQKGITVSDLLYQIITKTISDHTAEQKQNNNERGI